MKARKQALLRRSQGPRRKCLGKRFYWSVAKGSQQQQQKSKLIAKYLTPPAGFQTHHSTES
jgi:hypothetical protein